MSQSSYVLVRVNPDGSDVLVSEHASFSEGWQAGQYAVHEDGQGAYSLYRGDRRLAKFGHSRIMPRRPSFEWMVLP